MTKVVVVEIIRDEDTPVEARRYLVKLNLWRQLRGGAVEGTERQLWFTAGRFVRWPKAKTWALFERRTTDIVRKEIKREWGEGGTSS